MGWAKGAEEELGAEEEEMDVDGEDLGLLRGCRERREGAAADIGGKTRNWTRGRVAECPLCGRTLPYSNMARPQESCRP